MPEPSEANLEEARVLVPVGDPGKITAENSKALGPIKVARNAMGVPILDASGNKMPLGENGKPVAKGGKRKTLNKRKTRRSHKRKRYSRRR
jgi:hypothetical protein